MLGQVVVKLASQNPPLPNDLPARNLSAARSTYGGYLDTGPGAVRSERTQFAPLSQLTAASAVAKIRRHVLAITSELRSRRMVERSLDPSVRVPAPPVRGERGRAAKTRRTVVSGIVGRTALTVLTLLTSPWREAAAQGEGSADGQLGGRRGKDQRGSSGMWGKGVIDLLLLSPPGQPQLATSILERHGFQHQTTRDPFPEERPRLGAPYGTAVVGAGDAAAPTAPRLNHWYPC